jgi:low molecular weight protein-tyrosine phosphatase
VGSPAAAGAGGPDGAWAPSAGVTAAAGGGRPTRLLFVCLGNICRSPTAEGVMRALVRRAGLEGSVELESAGTGAWHVGSPPDARAALAAGARGVVLQGRARQVRGADFAGFDLLLAMDRENASDLMRMAAGERERAKVRLLREFDPASVRSDELDVPDPYYGAAGGFDEVFELVRAACEGLLEQIRAGRLP